MGATSYPGMTQPFSMGHTSNMSSVGVRQDSMGTKIKLILTQNVGPRNRNLSFFWIYLLPFRNVS